MAGTADSDPVGEQRAGSQPGPQPGATAPGATEPGAPGPRADRPPGRPGDRPSGRPVDPGLAGRVPRQAGPTDSGPRMGPAAPSAPLEPPPAEPDPGSAGPTRRRALSAGLVGTVARGVGELLITLGLVVALFLVYQLWVTDLVQARSQSRLHDRLATAWSTPARPATPAEPPPATRPDPAPGEGFAMLRIPRFGADYAPVIVEGVDEDHLRKGPGHYPGTAMPGEIGNFVVSGHRTTYGKPFNRLDELRAGDPIVVEVADRYYVYRTRRSEVVDPHRLDVVAPVPEQPGREPTSAVLTMTTCHPEYSAKSRLIVFAELDKTMMKTAGGRPPFEPGES
ncbi:class E sortase [Frankia sp. CNm7]|uniref:Class E sortase n=1 Tax=Frankia nepalensis TaxID=1836974 RepID=A0A937UM54_9ACTN|nr:class E sortase [Frankia nepalensis]MBL7499605.1 class E sortase [Frankia nepalensis]MBL7515724.1 class E sortase [Frankia nepalensis]MBL7517949.1 class E sortase [Frankia nepalensis]MBL7626492.1 class E sortase [Frankia nepalensis]